MCQGIRVAVGTVNAELLQGITGEPHFGLHGRAVGHPGSPRAPLAVAADRNVDHRRIARRNRRITKAEGFEHPGTEVLDNDIGSVTKLQCEIAGLRDVQVDADVALASVLLGVIAADVATAGERQPGEVAAGWFDLDHLGAEIQQMFGAVRPREHPAEIDDPHTFKWKSHLYRPSNRAAPGPLACREANPTFRS